MSLKKVIEEIRVIVNKALSDLKFEYISYDIFEPPKKEFGDLTTNVAFLLGKKNQKKPYEIARQLVSTSIDVQLKRSDQISLISNADAHQSGHINFNINFKNFNKFLIEIIKQDKILFPDLGKGTKITIEHTSVNPNKALHIGHLRNVIIGDSLYRLLKLTNHDVHVLNYIDDSGVQVADLIVAFKFAGFKSEYDDKSIKFDHYCGDIYVKINELYKSDQDLLSKRKLIIQEIEKGNTELAKFTNLIVEKIVQQQLLTAWRINARYDLLVSESQILLSNLWNNTFTLLKDKKIIHFSKEGKNNNCWVYKDDTDEEKVVVRSDQTATYIAKDISFAVWKLNLVKDPFTYSKFCLQWDDTVLWKTIINNQSFQNYNSKLSFNNENADIVITIIDLRQARLQRIISEIIESISNDGITKKYVYLGYETVALSHSTVQSIGLELEEINSKVVHMSGRKGIFINADAILDQLFKKASDEIKNRDSDIPNSNISELAEGIAVSAIRYNLIKQDLDKMITFDLKEALNLDGDTSLYLQYSFARANRILEKGEDFIPKITSKESFQAVNLDILIQNAEIDLIKEISKFNMIVEEAVNTLNPKIIAKYANRLSTKFNFFYESLSVLGDNYDLKVSRLILVKVFVIILTNLFDILGIQKFDRI
ncbi:MAG: arginine--tRNA ligase [Nitrososphaeraceae archaeon]